MVSVGEAAPDFTLPRDGGGTIALGAVAGRKVVLYFYPKDNTSGCTTEAEAFRDSYERFRAAGAEVIGISRDSVKSHDGFKAKHALPFPLASDADGAVCEAYGVWVEKSMYGRKYFGIERATFLIDESGMVSAVWRKVKVAGHAQAVLAAVNGAGG